MDSNEVKYKRARTVLKDYLNYKKANYLKGKPLEGEFSFFLCHAVYITEIILLLLYSVFFSLYPEFRLNCWVSNITDISF